MLLVSSFVVVLITQFAFQRIINGFSTNACQIASVSNHFTVGVKKVVQAPRKTERLRGSYQVVTARGMDSRMVRFCG